MADYWSQSVSRRLVVGTNLKKFGSIRTLTWLTTQLDLHLLVGVVRLRLAEEEVEPLWVTRYDHYNCFVFIFCNLCYPFTYASLENLFPALTYLVSGGQTGGPSGRLGSPNFWI